MTSITNDLIKLDHRAIEQALVVGQMHARRQGGRVPVNLQTARDACAAVRASYGFARRHAPLLTQAEDQLKLGKASTHSVGLTLYHNYFKSFGRGVINLCPSAGDCVRTCVIGNGNGMFDAVQRGWKWKSELLVSHPWAFFVLLGYELERTWAKHGAFLMRPNVNSDIEWERLAPALVDGSVFGDRITFYGYTKHASVLVNKEGGWLTPHYRVAYSWNENSSQVHVLDFLDRGGNVAVVTDRYYTSQTRQPIKQWGSHPVVDGDASDEWILKGNGVIGDLAYKPRTTALRRWGQTTEFVVKVYGKNGEMATLDDVRSEHV